VGSSGSEGLKRDGLKDCKTAGKNTRVIDKKIDESW
jgi:hypothetical protein